MYKYFAILLATFLVLSCEQSPTSGKDEPKTKSEILPRSNGSHAEMLALVSDEWFAGKTGEQVLKLFANEQDGLPQPEAIFKVMRAEPQRANDLLKRNKSILLIEKSDSTNVSIVKDVWARPQIVARISGPTDEAIAALLKEHGATIVERFQEHDRKKMRAVLYKSRMRKLPESITSLGIKKMILTEGFKQTLDRENLKIFKNKALRTDQYMIMYTESMREGVVSGEEIIRSRDSIGKNFVEGFRDSSYMATEMYIPPVQKIVEIGDMFAVETRGLWKTVGDFMGGPFLSYTIYDEVNDQIIVVEGMVYGPDSKKRNVLFELEVMMRSIVME
jgi:hypothetical protein